MNEEYEARLARLYPPLKLEEAQEDSEVSGDRIDHVIGHDGIINQPCTVVDAEGIRPLGAFRTISWPAVASCRVNALERGVVIEHVAGRSIRTGIPGDYLADIQSIGARSKAEASPRSEPASR